MAGGPPPATENVESLLDIDFDGGAPASAQKEPSPGSSGLEGLAGTPPRASSPMTQTPSATAPPPPSAGDLNDLMGVFGNGHAGAPNQGTNDMLSGLASLNLGAGNQPPPAHEQMGATPRGQKNNEDILGLF